jgi:hypothetical protein
LALFSSEQGITKAENLASIALIHGLSFQGVFRFGKGQGLHLNELSIRGDLIMPLMIDPMWWPSVHLLGYLLLRLQDLVQHFGLSGHKSLRRRHGWRWRQFTATGRSKPVGRVARGSHHLKCKPLLDT